MMVAAAGYGGKPTALDAGRRGWWWVSGVGARQLLGARPRCRRPERRRPRRRYPGVAAAASRESSLSRTMPSAGEAMVEDGRGRVQALRSTARELRGRS